MRIACLHIPCFYVQVERLKRPWLKGRPVVVGGRPDERASVIDSSEEAEERGVCPGLTVKEAHHLCPAAYFTGPDEEEAGALWDETVSLLQSFSMRIEVPGRGTACLDITKALDIYGGERSLAAHMVREIKAATGFTARAGIGNSLFVARSAALLARPQVHVVPPGRERQFVAHLSVETLPVDKEIKERLALLGLATLGKVAPLSVEALVAQFGKTGRLIRDISHGKGDVRPIPRMEGAACLEREVTSEAPIAVIGLLKVVLDEAVGEIAGELAKGRKACRAVGLSLKLRGGTTLERQWIMHAPTQEREEMVRRIMDGLAGATLESPVTGFTVYARGLTRCEPASGTLFAARSRDREGFRGVKDYLRAKYGFLPLARVEEADPDARLPERRFVFVEP